MSFVRVSGRGRLSIPMASNPVDKLCHLSLEISGFRDRWILRVVLIRYRLEGLPIEPDPASNEVFYTDAWPSGVIAIDYCPVMSAESTIVKSPKLLDKAVHLTFLETPISVLVMLDKDCAVPL